MLETMIQVLLFSIAALISAIAVLTWAQYMTIKDLNRIKRAEQRRKHLSKYRAHIIYKGSDCE